MLRALYAFALCLAIGLLATMWLRPGLAQELLAMAMQFRAQSPDAQGAVPFGDPQMPYSGVRPPTQPVPVARPVDWPGTPVDSYDPRETIPLQPNPSADRPITAAPAYVGIPGAAANPEPRQNSPFAAPPLGAQPYIQSRQDTAAQAASQPIGSPLPPTGAAVGAVYPQTAQPSSGYETARQTAQAQPVAPAPASSQVLPAPQAEAIAWPQSPPPSGALPSQVVAPPASQTLSIPAVQPMITPAATPIASSAPLGSPAAAQQPVQNTAPDITPVDVQPGAEAAQEFDDAKIVARVGSEVVLEGDVKAMVADWLARKKMKVPEEQQAEFNAQAGRQMLKQLVETKMVYNDAVHAIPAANLPTIESQVNKMFDNTQIPQLFETHGVSSKQELDARLREQGSSLERERRNFFERSVAQNWLGQSINTKEEIPHSEVLAYYQQHMADYEFPAKARWQELMVRFDRFPSKEAAYAALADMGNEVMRGAAFDSIAKARSQGLTASDGGAYDWTTRGSLVAKKLDEAIFALPVGSLSQILESEQGFHIVRVIERKDAGRKPFTDAQGEIKKQLKEDSLNRHIHKYLDDIRNRTPVWTIYDDQPGGLDGPKER